MSELPITPFATVPGLESFGDGAAGFCADGVCEVPDSATPEASGLPKATGSREGR